MIIINQDYTAILNWNNIESIYLKKTKRQVYEVRVRLNSGHTETIDTYCVDNKKDAQDYITWLADGIRDTPKDGIIIVAT